MGEYARCLALATALSQRLPALEIRFVLSREAPYAAATPFATMLLPASATLHPREVSALIREWQPRLVVFDNAGRTAQLRAAQAAGARIVYLSSRRRQRRRAFRLQWMRLIDEHWIAYPQFIAGAPGPLERLKLRLLGRPRIRFIDTLLPPADPALGTRCLERFSLTARKYVLIVPGGGSAHPGAENAPAIVAAAACAIAQRVPALLVGAHAGGGEPAALQLAPRLPLPELCELIRSARLVVTNGGDTLLQVLACSRPCVAVPIAHDQAHRIDCCVRAGLAVRAPLEAHAIESAALRLLSDGAAAGVVPPGQPQVRNCLEEALRALQDLL
jgi:UDP:flavonoid glycosyltransferase YjiC (YdhE family)